MLAVDDVPVLMHDPTLERTALTVGAVSERSAAELERIDVGGWHSARFIGETVPTLQRTLRFCREHDIWPNIEIKPGAGFEAATGAAVARVTAEVYADLMRPGGDARRSSRRLRAIAVFVCPCGADRSARGGAGPAARLAGGPGAARVAQRNGAPEVACRYTPIIAT